MWALKNKRPFEFYHRNSIAKYKKMIIDMSNQNSYTIFKVLGLMYLTAFQEWIES